LFLLEFDHFLLPLGVIGRLASFMTRRRDRIVTLTQGVREWPIAFLERFSDDSKSFHGLDFVREEA
jgi:hypothetical protein